MRTRTGTGYVVALLLAFALMCSGPLSAQTKDGYLTTSIDKLTPGVQGAANATADINSVDCFQWSADHTVCIAGQYFHGDGTIYDLTWHDQAVVTLDGKTPRPNSLNQYGNWIGGNYGNYTGGTLGPTAFLRNNNGCLSCHHSVAAGNGSPYLIGGHKNLMRKVVPGQKIFGSNGDLINGSVLDHDGGGPYTFDYLTGSLNGTGTAYYFNGAEPAPGVYGTGTPKYGSCGRCHMTGYRFDANGPEPTSLDPTTNTYTKLTDAQFSRIPAGSKSGDTTTTSSWYLTSIQCERCHRVDVQTDPSLGLTPSSAAGRIGHHNIGGVASGANGIVPNDGKDYTVTPYRVPGSDLTLTGAAGATVSAGVTAPYALLCVECHQAAATFASTTAGKVGEVHMTPLPGFEALAPTTIAGTSTTKPPTGQFTATWGCTGATGTIAKNDYDGCVNAGGTVTYVPGGMSHGAVATILNSPHGRVTGYVDYKSQATGDTTMQINGGTVNGVPVVGQFNTHFASESGVSGSCMGCHNVHGYLDGYFETTATNVEQSTLKECKECHADHAKTMAHPVGNGTPWAQVNKSTGAFGAQESCNVCHFAKKTTGIEYHFLRINPDVNYNTFPDARTYYTTVGSGLYGKLNTYNSGETYKDANGATQAYPAVGLDIDIVCGQCHTGGNGVKNPYGITPYAGDNADGSGFVAPRPYSRAFLASKITGMHSTTPDTPTLSIPLPAFGGPTTITISSADVSEGSKIGLFYTLDGTTPQVQVGPDYVSYVPKTGTTTIACAGNPCDVAINSTATLFAIAAGPKTYNFGVSGVTGGTYGIQVAPTPTIAPTGANLTWSSTLAYPVKLTDIAGSVCYTTDGSIPVVTAGACVAPAIGVPTNTTITVNKSMVIKAVGFGASYGTSNVATATFTVKPATPTWSNVAPAKYPGTYVGAQQARLNDADPNATICYTTNGATPVVPCNGTSVAPGTLIPVGSSMTIKAIAIDGTTASTATSGTFVIK